MKRIVVFGNSGSGKSTYAKELSATLGGSHLDLDTVAWEPDAETPTRRSLDASRMEIREFIDSRESWVVEGCYSDLLEIAMSRATEIVFLNPGADVCVDNARNRPWEPHKYSSPEAQDANLAMLIEWIKTYDRRTDEFSCLAHRRLFEEFDGRKQEFNSNERNT
ncbi:MAG: shikimate kinase [Proteobacteria bacterium]|nr:MAG: shikimate kinase [Pseudomonadota bacterium]